MYGAILGDIIGSIYEFEDYFPRTNDFPLFSWHSTFTDDTVMTLAVAKAFLDTQDLSNDNEITQNIIKSMQKYGRAYPDAGYGGTFIYWLFTNNPHPYYSYGNGSAMRVSSAAWLFKSISEVRRAARLSAVVTHNHPEGIKGAEATAAAVFLARTGHSKEEIKSYIESEFEYNLNLTCQEIKSSNRNSVSCMATVPEAITAFLESADFEDCIKTAISFGGDCDTLAAIAGSIAEGFYGVPQALKDECHKRLPDDLNSILKDFNASLID